MTEISAKTVKELRDMTGAGMMDCKRALKECEGNIDEAKDWLRKRGRAIADKKASRKAGEGLIYCALSDDRTCGTILELNCETDFVARNDEFIGLIKGLTEHVNSGAPGTENNSSEELIAAPSHEDPSIPMSEMLRQKVAKVGENITIGGFARLTAESGGCFASYIHPPGKLGVLLQMQTGKPDTQDNDAFKGLCSDLAMHIAATDPKGFDRDSLDSDLVEHERNIYLEQVKLEGKPENIIDKIVDGKMGKFYKQSCFLEQDFVKEPDISVTQLVERVAKEIGDEIKVTRFERMKVGG